MVNYISIIIAMAMSSMTNISGYPKIINSSWARVNNNKNNFTKSPLLYSINK